MINRMLMVLALLAACFAALCLGPLRLGPLALLHGALTGEGTAGLVLGVIRGPRVACAVGAGAALGLSGLIFQTLFRNPLAAPDLMGFTSGASLAIVAATASGLLLPMPLVAAAGGLAAAALVFLAAHRPGRATPPLTLVLVGLGIGFLSSALTSFVMTILPPNDAADAQRWLTGSLNARNWDHAAQIWGALILLIPLAVAALRALSALELGEDLAAGLGVAPGRARLGLAATGLLLAAAAVMVAGPVPFVALMAAPLGARLVAVPRLAERMFAAGVTGALVLVLSDLAASAAVPGVSLPAGVVTGLLGAPYLMWRLAREMRSGGL